MPMTLTRSLMAGTAIVLMGAVALPAAQAPRRFEAESVKRQTSPGPGIVAVTGTRVSGPFVTLRSLVQSAYGFDRDQVLGGPGWTDTDHFEVNATMRPGESREDAREMLRTLLADRFGLAAHIEKRDLPVTILTFGGQLGPKMRRSGPDCAPGTTPAGLPVPPPPPPPPAGAAEFFTLTNTPTGSKCGSLVMNGYISGRDLPVATLAWMLAQQTRRPVLDRTGLTEKYDFDLMYLPDTGPPAMNGNPIPWEAPALATAVREQLGLKLDSARAPVDVVVIDRASPPTEN